MRSVVISGLMAAFLPTASQAIEMPRGATEVFSEVRNNELFHVPVAAFSEGTVPVTTGEGTVDTMVWQLENTGLSTNQIAVSLRDQLKADGYEIILDCRDIVCGGFDFRYNLSLVDEPLMHVDLGNFRFVSAEKAGGKDQPNFATVMVSKSPGRAFIQLTQAGESDQGPVVVASTRSREILPVLEDAVKDVTSMLLQDGFAVLGDVRFETGSPNVSNADAESLAELARFLIANPDKTVALVGHTDAVGSLVGNVSLSKKRARSVLDLLVSRYNVPPGQLEADGVGYLAPRTSNLTDQGRTQNRRVEAILTSTR